MDRRRFLSSVGLAAAALASPRAASAQERETAQENPTAREKRPQPKPVRMVVGTQRPPTNHRMLEYFKRHGVDHICGYPRIVGNGRRWSVDDLKRTKELCDQHGVALDMVALPFLTSSHIDREKRGAILLADSPERDRDIEDIQKMIAACAAVGIPAFKYNMSLLGVLRTDTVPGRGGSRHSSWQRAGAKPEPPLTRAGRVDAERFWERITYFLERIIPVCEQYRIRAACHPHDPGVPPSGYQGVDRVLGTVEGLQEFISIEESPYHGLNLCLGTTAEMLQNPAEEIHDVIRYFGERKTIFNIHFRNIRGRRGDFQEVYPDEGDLDMFRVLRTLHEVDYPYMVMPDHMPRHDDDPGGRQAFAFGYGYIKGLLQALGAFPPEEEEPEVPRWV